MVDPVAAPLDPNGEARRALQDAVKDYGGVVLSRAHVLNNFLKDQLGEDLKREASLLVSAANSDVAAVLAQRLEAGDPGWAVRSTAQLFASDHDVVSASAVWAVEEFATALGHAGALDAPGSPERVSTVDESNLLDDARTEEEQQSLTRQLNEILEATVSAARSSDRADLAERLVAEASLEAQPSLQVVVAGETKTGKSSFINALLGQPDLLPVADDLATNVHIVIRYMEQPRTIVYFDDGRAPVVISADEIARWASVSGNPHNKLGVHNVEVGLDLPVLAKGLVICDTPGVGGLESGHARVTMNALTHADALVFAVRSTEPLTKPELEFLQEATERIDAVLFALTKVDLGSSWQTILDEDRELLSQAAPRYKNASFFPVSSKLKRAADLGHSRATELFARSGFASLEEELTRLARRWQDVRLINLLRFIRGTIDVLIRMESIAIEEDASLREQLEHEQARLRALELGNSRWPRQLANGLAGLDRQLKHDMAAATSALGRRLRPRIGEFKGSRDDFVEDTRAEMRAIVDHTNEQLLTGVAQIERELIAMISVPELDVEGAPLPDVRTIEELQLYLDGKASGDKAMINATSARLGYLGVQMPISLGSLGFAVGGVACGVAFIVPAVIFGGVLAAISIRSGSKQKKTRELQPIVEEALEKCRLEIPYAVSDRMDEVRHALEDAARTRIAELAQLVRVALEKAQQLQRSDQQTRLQLKQRADQRRASLISLGESVDRFLIEANPKSVVRPTKAALGGVGQQNGGGGAL
jgi:hypothetical protein